MAERYEKDRGAWVLARAGRRAGARRRGEILTARARRRDRTGAGIGDAATAEIVTPSMVRRSVMREEGAGNTAGWALWTAVWLLSVALLVGPAWALSRLVYLAWWTTVPRVGRMRSLPLALASLLALAGSIGSWWLWPPAGIGFLRLYGCAQLVLGLAWCAVLVRANGWAAVAAQVRSSSAKIAPVSVGTPAASIAPVVVGAPSVEEITRPLVSDDEVASYPDEFEDLYSLGDETEEDAAIAPIVVGQTTHEEAAR